MCIHAWLFNKRLYVYIYIDTYVRYVFVQVKQIKTLYGITMHDRGLAPIVDLRTVVTGAVQVM